MNVTTKVHMCLILVAGFMAVLNPVPLMAQAPVIQSIVPETAPSSGIGQMITIQGFNLIQGDLEGTTVTFTKGKRRFCSDVFLLPGSSTANELYVRIYNPEGPCDIPKGKYTVTVTTGAGPSNAWRFQVHPKPQAPIPRKVLLAGDPDCPGSEDYNICVQAYGTDTSNITAVFSQNETEVSALLVTTRTGGTLGLTHGFKLPELLVSAEIALVQLRTTVDEVDSDLSFALLFTVPSVP